MSSYLSQFEKTTRELYEIESQIRRLTGRDLDDVTAMTEEVIFVKRIRSPAGKKSTLVPSDRPTSYRQRPTSYGQRPTSYGQRPTSYGQRPTSYRQRPSYTERKRPRERESSYEEYSSSDESSRNKPVIKSTIVAKSQNRSRKDAFEEQNANPKLRMRNQRMFCALAATLKKFQSEEVERQKQESMRAEMESKVEAARQEDRERIKREKEHLFVTRREKQSQLHCLEKKIERAESHEVFDANHHCLLNYIMTKSKPSIFFMPSSHTPETRKAHQESKSKIEDIIKKRKESFENDLAEIDECYRKDSSMPGDKENKRSKEESESRDVPETESESVVIEQEDTGHDSNSNQISNSNSNLSSDSNDDDEDSSTAKNVGSLTDFEPDYD